MLVLIMLLGLVAYLLHKWNQINRRLEDAEEVISRDKRMEMFYRNKRENTENERELGYLWPIIILIVVYLVWNYLDPKEPELKQTPKVEIPKDTIQPIIES